MKIVFLIGVVLVFLGTAYALISRTASAPAIDSPKHTLLPESVTPTPFPFQELTIPYLRSQTYTSSLTVGEKAYETSVYTASFASFTSQGLKVNGLLTLPKTSPPQGGWPAIIFIHGYIPPQQYVTTRNYYDYVDYLAKNGFVVFKIDLRGHGTSEGEPGGAYYSSDYIFDTLSAYTALQQFQTVNPNRIGLWGHSMAGNIVLRSMAVKPDIPAAVIWAGAVYTYVDFQTFGISDASYQPPASSSERVRKRQQLVETHGQPSTSSAFWQQVAATSYLKDIQGAIALHHARNDNVVSINYSSNLVNLLQQSSIQHEFHAFSGGGHNITGSYFTEAMQRTVQFFTTHLD